VTCPRLVVVAGEEAQVVGGMAWPDPAPDAFDVLAGPGEAQYRVVLQDPQMLLPGYLLRARPEVTPEGDVSLELACEAGGYGLSLPEVSAPTASIALATESVRTRLTSRSGAAQLVRGLFRFPVEPGEDGATPAALPPLECFVVVTPTAVEIEVDASLETTLGAHPGDAVRIVRGLRPLQPAGLRDIPVLGRLFAREEPAPDVVILNGDADGGASAAER